ncbi:MAG: DUF3619 family protein [Burkholderiaceae bacterium]
MTARTIKHPVAFAAPPSQADALEARVALRIVNRLSATADELPHDITERLRVAREQALDRARALRKLSAAPAALVAAQAGGAAVLAGPPSWWLRLASALPVVVLVGGLLFIQHRYNQEQISAAAEVDAALLVDELPPQAYSDPGFAEYLRTPRDHE